MLAILSARLNFFVFVVSNSVEAFICGIVRSDSSYCVLLLYLHIWPTLGACHIADYHAKGFPLCVSWFFIGTYKHTCQLYNYICLFSNIVTTFNKNT